MTATNRRKQTRWRSLGTEQRGWRVARVEDRSSGDELRVYFRLGRWRLYANDDPVRDAALAACARRALSNGQAGESGK